jgi:hypothetical protein
MVFVVDGVNPGPIVFKKTLRAAWSFTRPFLPLVSASISDLFKIERSRKAPVIGALAYKLS